MSKHEHVTFTRGQDVVEHAIRYLEQVTEVLESLRERELSERVKMLLNSVEVEHRNLVGSLERLLEDAPDKALATFTQYTVEMPTEVAPPEEQPLTTLGLTRWLEESVRPVQFMCAELAEHRDAEEASELFGGIAQQIEAHERTLSKEYQRTEDL